MKIGKFCIFLLLLIMPVFVLAAAPAIPSVLNIDEGKAIIAGVTPKETEVIIYVDDKFFGLAEVVASDTASDSFNFSLFGLLPKGEHEIKVASKDIETKSLSKFSQIETIQITEATRHKPKVSIEAETEEVVINNEAEQKDDTTEKKEEYLLDINDLPEAEGDKENEQKKILHWNLFVFILFLIAIISWILWVNNELKKEKEEEEEKKEE